ncbi:hypothetical protein AAF712_015298 [Marasmius tenuissimus]|uniref:Uncharacterized protein n=1 Tax=Marasmius tenuissimus TaxID=585030 RepID=A0ABR2Z9Z8_9AGAR
MSGLAPTLIIVRVAYGKSVESVQQMVSIHFAERETQQEAGANALRATVNIRSRTGAGALQPHNPESAKTEGKRSTREDV